MCRGLSMATPRFVIIVIAAVSVSSLMGATWESGGELAEPPTFTVSGGNPPALSHTTLATKIRRVTREGHNNNNDHLRLLLIGRALRALTPSNPPRISSGRLRRQSQQQPQQSHVSTATNSTSVAEASLSIPPIITRQNANHNNNDNDQDAILLHLHSKQSQILLTPLESSSASNKLVRSRGGSTQGHFPPFPGTLTSQESTISSSGGGTDTQRLRLDAKSQSQSPSSSSLAAVVVNSIRCACDTSDCSSNSENVCLTSGMCYTQFLDKIIRGCISEATPLLCENRRPAVSGSRWPYLHCCTSDMCNAGVLTIPSTHLINIATVNHNSSRKDPFRENSHNHIRTHRVSKEKAANLDEIPETSIENQEKAASTKGDAELSPGIISFFIGSAVYVVVLSVLGFIKLFLWRRKQSRKACYYKKDNLEQPEEAEVEENRGVQSETCLSSPVNTEETIDYESNQISISIPCHHYVFQQQSPHHHHHPHPHHKHSTCMSVVSAPTPATAIRLSAKSFVDSTSTLSTTTNAITSSSSETTELGENMGI